MNIWKIYTGKSNLFRQKRMRSFIQKYPLKGETILV